MAFIVGHWSQVTGHGLYRRPYIIGQWSQVLSSHRVKLFDFELQVPRL